jgi:hypothetical protein
MAESTTWASSPEVQLLSIRIGALVQAPSIPDDRQGEFERLVDQIGLAFAQLAATSGVNELEVSCVLADDFVNDIEWRMRRLGESEREGFTTERIGGVVVAKNLPQNEDDSQVAIVFAPKIWAADGYEA